MRRLVNKNCQRLISVGNLERLLNHEFCWSKFGCVGVVRRVDKDGDVHYSTVDGQHRIANAIIKGITRIPVMVFDNAHNDPTVEPTLFRELNNGQAIDKIDIHRVLIQLGDQEHLDLEAMVVKYNYYFHQKGNFSRNTGIAKIQYLEDIMSHYPKKWRNLLDRAFNIYSKAFCGVSSVESDLIKHIAIFLDKADVFLQKGMWTDQELITYLSNHKLNSNCFGRSFRSNVINECKRDYDRKNTDFKTYWFTNWLADNWLDVHCTDSEITDTLRILTAAQPIISHELLTLNKLLVDNPDKIAEIVKVVEQ